MNNLIRALLILSLFLSGQNLCAQNIFHSFTGAAFNSQYGTVGDVGSSVAIINNNGSLSGGFISVLASMPFEGCIQCDSSSIGDIVVVKEDTFIVVNRSMLDSMILGGHDVTKACVSQITDMRNLFKDNLLFNQEIGLWDVSNVVTMEAMFNNAQNFNQDISKWDVSSVINMKNLFKGAKSFNQYIGSWNVRSVTNMVSMFFNAENFNQPISSWNVGSVEKMTSMFCRASSFNQNLNSWNVSDVTHMSRMFKEATLFNKRLDNWNVSSVIRMSEMFKDAYAFNQNLSSWCVSYFQYTTPSNFATNSSLFAAYYPQWGNCPNTYELTSELDTGAFVNSRGCIDCSALNIGSYFELNGDTLLVVDRSMLDSLVEIHADLSKVCVSNITDMKDALRGLRWFNSNISSWDVSNVTDMTNMFFKSRLFNQDIGNWDVSNVSKMSRMFQVAQAFNQDIGNWDVANVQRFQAMFRNADAFNQDIGSWDVSSVLNHVQMTSMFRSADNFSQDLSEWCVTNASSKPSGFDANSALVLSQLPIWGTCPTASPPAAFVNSRGCIDCLSLNIGDQFVLNGESMIVVDRPMLDSMVIGGYDVTKACVSHITDMSFALAFAPSNFNQSIGTWDVSNVTNMSYLFITASAFNQDIGNWDVSKVTDMNLMFYGASSFNQDIGAWETGNVNSMDGMFTSSTLFNQDIGDWNVGDVTSMNSMFQYAANFNQNLTKWCVSNIPSKPLSFDFNSPLVPANMPLWGSCPPPQHNSKNSVLIGEKIVHSSKNKIDISQTVIVPNPVSKSFNLVPQVLNGNYRIINSSGQIVLAGKIKESFDVQSLSAGMYILLIETETRFESLRFTKK